MKNPGKIFEQQFRKSIPAYVLLIRLNDTAQSFKKSNYARFTPENPCDFILFNSKKCQLICLECKSTKNKSMSFEDVNTDKVQNRMIHKHQISNLTNYSKYNNVIGCFLFNFRDEENKTERTYFQDIRDFNKMCISINKVSFNEIDLTLNGAIKINGVKKRLHYIWDIDELLQKI